VLEVGREYEITVSVFDKTNHRIVIGEVSTGYHVYHAMTSSRLYKVLQFILYN